MPSRRTRQSYSAAAERGPSAAHGASVAATSRTASAVDVVARSVAPGSSARRNRAHWPSGCGCDTRPRSRRARPVAAIRQLRIASTVSPTIATSRASRASASSVALTPPSSEFSIGTSARSIAPPWTAMTVSWIDGNGRARPRRRRRGRRPHRLLAERAGGPEVAQAHQRRCSALSGTSPASATRIASCSSGESSSSRSPRRPASRTAAPGRGGGSRRRPPPTRGRRAGRSRSTGAPTSRCRRRSG